MLADHLDHPADGPDVETDRGPRDGRKGPVRTCIATRTSGAPDDMVRFAVGPDGVVVPDLAGRLPGRGRGSASPVLRLKPQSSVGRLPERSDAR